MARQRSRARRKELARGVTKPQQCTRMIPGVSTLMPPFRCEARCSRHGLCAAHDREQIQASEARAIEARTYRVKQIAAGRETKRGRVALPTVHRLPRTTTYIPKGERKAKTKAAA